MRAFRLIAAIAVASLALALLLDSTDRTSSRNAALAASYQCPDVAIYGVRGSGEPRLASDSYMGPLVYKVAQALVLRLGRGIRTAKIGVEYPAVSVSPPDIRADLFRFNGYQNSVVAGANNLVNGTRYQIGLAQEVAKCPQVKLVLIGLSQGSHVIRYAMSAATSSTEKVIAHIVAILLFGDPVRQPHEPFDVGPIDAHGIFVALHAFSLPGNSGPPEMPRFLDARTRSYCLDKDPICDTTSGSLSFGDAIGFFQHQSIHSSYPSSAYVGQAVTFSAGLINPPILGPPAPAPAPAPAPVPAPTPTPTPAPTPTGYWVDVDESGATASGGLGGTGSLTATGQGNVNYGYAQECAPSQDGGPFSLGNYPPATCAGLGRAYNSSGSPEQPAGFWFTGNQHCVAAARPFSGANFTWHVKLPASGHWHVDVYIPSWTSYGWGDQYILRSDDGESQSTGFIQQVYHGQWVTLFGAHQFTASEDYTVELTLADSSDSYCHYQMADQMRWVYDGP